MNFLKGLGLFTLPTLGILFGFLCVCVGASKLFNACTSNNRVDYKALYLYEKNHLDSTHVHDTIVLTGSKKTVEIAAGQKGAVQVITVYQKVMLHDTVPFVVIRDTCRYISRTFHDSSISGRIDNSGVIIDSISLKNRITLTALEAGKYIRFKFENSDTAFHVTGLNSIMYEKPNAPRLNFGLFAGWDVLNNKPSLGVGVSYTLFHLK